MPTSKPNTVSNSNEGAASGTGSSETPSKRTKGGTPPGVPTARKERRSLVASAVKVSVWYCHPVNPSDGVFKTAVSCVSLPKDTSHCAVEEPEKPACCAPAHQNPNV